MDERLVSPVVSYGMERTTAAAAYTKAKVENVRAQPVIKDLITPATAAMVAGVLQASDVVVNYALPEESETKEESATVAVEPVMPRALALSTKVRSRVGKRLSAAGENMTKMIEARKEAVVHTNLIQYSRTFLGKTAALIPDSVSATWESTEGQIATERITKLAQAVLATYTVQLNSTVQPYILAVSNYGEHFMERVHQYEEPGAGEEGEAKVDEQMKPFIERIAARFIEPALVRIVAVFLVLGDEVKSFRIKKLEPAAIAIRGAWEQMDLNAAREHATQNAKLVYDAVYRKTTDLATAGLKATNLDGFYDAAVQEYMKLDADGDGSVTFEEFQLGVRERMGKEYDEKMAPLITKAFAAAKQTKVARALLSVPSTFSDLKAAAYAEWIQLDKDGNNDGAVSFDEFRAGVQSRLSTAWTDEMIPVLRKMHLASQEAASGDEFVDAAETEEEE